MVFLNDSKHSNNHSINNLTKTMKQKAIKKKKDISAPTPPPPKDKTDTPTNQSAYS